MDFSWIETVQEVMFVLTDTFGWEKYPDLNINSPIDE